MKVKDVYHQLLSFLPLADVRTVFDGYFGVPFDSWILHDNEEIEDKKVAFAMEKLKAGYPANYLAGYIDIAGLHLFLNEDTLIPRTETEDFLLNLLPSLYNPSHKKVLDLCTGSGFIALTVKKMFPTAEVIGSDISKSALKKAEESASFNHLDVTFLQSDYLENIQDTFDLILSNPPYIEEGSKEVDAPFEPPLALYSGRDGLDSYRKIFASLKSHLKEGGVSYFELESTNSLKTKELAEKMLPDKECRILKDLYGRDRYLGIK